MENNQNRSFFKRASDASSNDSAEQNQAPRRPRMERPKSNDRTPQRANRSWNNKEDQGGFKKGGFNKGGFNKGGGFKGKDNFRGNDNYKGNRNRSDENEFPRKGEPAPLQAPENIIFGIHPVREALEAGVAVEKIYVKKGTDAAQAILDYADARGIQVQEVPVEKLDKLTRRNNHQGIVAVVPQIEYADINQVLEDITAQEKPALIVVLDSVTDIRNFGAIARTAECVGADAIVVSAKNSAPVNAEAIKSSAGALAQIPVCRVGSLRNTLKQIQASGISLVASTEKTNELLYETKLTGSVAIIMGAEDSGISTEILKMCDSRISIPMLGRIESLNVSAAAAVVLYEVVRQRFEAVDAEE